jgi:hypothetical protein
MTGMADALTKPTKLSNATVSHGYFADLAVM